MKINKINHQTQKYQCGLGTTLANLTNGNLRFDYPLLSIGMNNYQIETSIKYNSHYKTTDFNGKKIGFNNGWKLNIHQYIFPYLSSYDIEEFEVGNYIYIDENWNIHRFVKYKDEIIDGLSNAVYYDCSNALLKLFINDNTSYIKDDYNNKFVFNKEGLLISLISGVNENVKKLITYDNGNLNSIYDPRKSSRSIYFTYNNDLLIKVQTTINNIGFEFSYNENKLETIQKYSGNISKEVMNFKYNLNNIMEYSINPIDLNALRYVYTMFKGEAAITKIMFGLVEKEIVPDLSSEFFVGDDIYLSDVLEDNKKNYITNNYFRVSDYVFSMPIANVKEEVNLTYNDSYTQVTNDSGINLRYYFNVDGTTISCLEYKERDLYSLSRIKGHILSSDGSLSTKFNGEKINILSPDINNKIIFDSDNNKLSSFLNSLKNEYGEIKESEQYSEHFNISFWIKFRGNSQSNLIAKIIYSINGIEKEAITMIENTKVGSWQQVVVPINLGTNQLGLQFVELQIEGCAENTQVELTNMMISKGNTTQLYLYSNFGVEYKEFKIDFGKVLQIDGADYIISPSFYMTANDLFLTYRNIYNKKKNNDYKFDLIYNNCTKVKTVESVKLKLDNVNVYPFVVDNNIPNYYLKVVDIIEDEKYIIMEQQTSFHTDVSTAKNYYEFKTMIGEIDSIDETTKRLKDESSAITYTWQNEDGTFRASKNTGKVITENYYDNCGNILKTVVYNEEQESAGIEDTTPIETVYNYVENFGYSREHIKSITNNGITIQYEYDEDGLLTNLVNKGIRTAYNYDSYKELVKSINSKDMSNVLNETNTNINYSKSGNIKHMNDGNNCIYGFKYNAFNELSEVYKDKKLLYEISEIKDGNNTLEVSTLYQDINKSFLTFKVFDEVGRLTSIGHEENNVTFKYENDNTSRLISRVKKIEDDFTGDVYNFTYDETNEITEKKEIVNKLEKTIYTDNKVKYKFKDGEKFEFEFKKDNNSSPNIVLTKNRYIDANDIQNIDLLEFSFGYTYDKLGRLSSKVGFPIIYEKCQGCLYGGYDNCGDYDGVFINKSYSYVPGTILPKNISYTINSKDKNDNINGITGPNIASTFIYSNESYDNNGNITKIVEDGVIFSTNPIGEENRLQKVLTSKEYEYSYDAYNRLVKEKNTEFGEFDYLYDNNKNELKQVNKNGVITKLFTYNNGLLTNVYKDDKITLINYDKYGNMLNIDDAVLTYNSRNMLDSYVNYYTNNSVYFSYNYQGVRYQKRCGSIKNGNIINSKIVNYYLDGTKILGEDWSDSDENVYCKFRYFYDNEGITGIRYDGYNYNLVRDTLGNISKVMYQGKVLGEYIYDAWGNCIIKELNTLDDRERFVLRNNPFRYRGYYYDVETGLFYCNSRYYNPEWGRWISPDDIEYLDPESVNGLNLYCYCYNNPIMYSDPSGNSPTKWWEWALAGVAVAGLIVGSIFTCGTLAGAVLAGAALGAGMSLVTQATSGELNWGQFALDTGVGAITGLIGGSGVSRGLATILGGVVGAGSNFVSQLINLQPGEKISIMEIIFAGAVGAVASYIGGAGARNKAALRGSEGYKSAASKLSRTTQRIFNGTRFNNPTTAQATFTKAMNGLTNAIQMEMSNMFYTAMLSYGVSTIGFSMANGLVNHFGGWAF